MSNFFGSLVFNQRNLVKSWCFFETNALENVYESSARWRQAAVGGRQRWARARDLLETVAERAGGQDLRIARQSWHCTSAQVLQSK